MNLTFCKYFFLSLMVLSPVFTVGSSRGKGSDRKFSTKSNKAKKLFIAAEQEYQSNGNFSGAKSLLAKSLQKDNQFIEAYLMRGYINMDQGYLDSAIYDFTKSIAINPKFHHPIFKQLAMLEYSIGQYEKSKEHIVAYLKSERIKPASQLYGEKLLSDCDFAINQKKNPAPIVFENLGSSVNTDKHEYFPRLTTDQKKLIFTRRLESGSGFAKYNEDFFVSSSDGNNNWSFAKNLKAINSYSNEGAPTLSSDGSFLIYTICFSIVNKWGKGDKGEGSCDLFSTKKVGNKWSSPKNLGSAINTKDWESQPSFSADGKTLFFVRGIKRPRKPSNSDIYFSELTATGKWSTPVKLSDEINTPMDEAAVFIHPDGKTLYFCSNGYQGMGGIDIYMSKRLGYNKWSTPVNLGYPINTNNDEMSFVVNASGTKGYISSDRDGGKGGLDIYSFDMPEKFKPNLVTYLSGRVFNKLNKVPLDARFELIDVQTKELVAASTSDKLTGKYLVSLPFERNYALNVYKDGFLFYSENFSLKGKDRKKPFTINVGLSPIMKGAEVELKNVFFETNKYDLKQESLVELNKLVSFLKLNQKLKIVLEGHTDNVGTEKANQILSEKRVGAVYEYIVSKGVDALRMKTIGLGDKKPIADNKSSQGRAKNRRTVFKIIEIEN